MKCPLCNGRKKILEPCDGGFGTIPVTCYACNGTGEVTMTNEKWFCQLPTTEKSEFLSAMVKQAIKVYEIHGCTWHETVSWWDGWLKENHND